MQWPCPCDPLDPAVAGDAAQGQACHPACVYLCRLALVSGVRIEDFGAGVLNLHMFCSSPAVLDMVVAAAGRLWHVVTQTFEFAGLKIRKAGHPVPGICVLMHHYFFRRPG